MNVKPRCKHQCVFIQISDRLFLCPHAAYGASSYLVGAVEEARRLLERQGGYDVVLARLKQDADNKRKASSARNADKSQALAQSLRYQ